MDKYKLYHSNIILENYDNFVKSCYWAYHKHQLLFNKKDSTWSYDKYNLFSITSYNLLFYYLLKELKLHIRSYIGDDRPAWFQSWINFHKQSDVLKKHSHDWDFHGYICVDPKDTTTVFEQYEIKNKKGQIYIGPGRKGYEHYVRVNNPYEGERITIGFDVMFECNKDTKNVGLIPLI